MKRTLIALCAALTFGFVGYVGAQSDQYGGQNTPKAKSSERSTQSREVTLSGCLEQGASPKLFVLRNVTEENQSGGISTGTSGSPEQNEQRPTSGQSSMQGQQMGMDFQLVGKDKDLKKYVGQRVEVRGVVEPMKENRHERSGSMSGSESGTQGTSGSQTSSQSGSQQSGSMSSSGSMSGEQTTAGPITHRVKVKSVRQLSSSCQ